MSQEKLSCNVTPPSRLPRWTGRGDCLFKSKQEDRWVLVPQDSPPCRDLGGTTLQYGVLFWLLLCCCLIFFIAPAACGVSCALAPPEKSRARGYAGCITHLCCLTTALPNLVGVESFTERRPSKTHPDLVGTLLGK